MIYLYIGIAFVMGIIVGWLSKMPFSHAFLKRELVENMKILEKIQEFRNRDKKAIIK